MDRIKTLILLLFYSGLTISSAQEIAVLKYSGGGDWYANPTALPNLITFCNANINTAIKENPQTVTSASTTLFQYPYVHMTGHGNVFFSDEEAKNVRTYLLAGGFLHIDDNYGMEPYLRKELVKIFPDKELVEIPADHPIFKEPYSFPQGLPKIHEHDGKPPQGFGLFDDNGRLMLFYSYESDLGDGWEPEEVHNDDPAIRIAALRMGTNILTYAMMF